LSFALEFIRILAIALQIAIIARVVLSWVNLSPSNPLVIIIYGITEPMLKPIRRILPDTGRLDFSPIIVIIVVMIAQWAINAIIMAFAQSGPV